MSQINKSPKVSIILPTYNRADLIAAAIKSIIDQSFTDFEIIVIDDCSTDDTSRVISLFDDPRIKYIYLSRHKGAAFARNEGLKVAFGDFIAFADSDDIWLKEKLKKQVEVLLNAPDDLVLVYSAVWKISGRKRVLFPGKNMRTKKSGDVHKHLLFGNFVPIHVLIRKQCLERVGMFDEKLPRLQDWDLWLRLSKKYKFFYLNEPLATEYKNADAISNNNAYFAIALEMIIKKFIKEFSLDPKLLAKYYYVLGRSFYEIKEIDKGKKYLRMALDLFPFDLKYMFFAGILDLIKKKR